MSTTDPQRSVIARAATLLAGNDRDWRMEFILLRQLQQFPALKNLAERLDSRFRARLDKRTNSIFPYFRDVSRRSGLNAGVSLASEFAETPGVSPAALVETAKFFFSCGRFALGDELIERAKSADPLLPRIYDEEAWNQRARGNLHRELQAVKHSIELAEDSASRLGWEMWYGEALLRLGDPDAAWNYLKKYSELPRGTQSIFSAAACAARLGKLADADRAYAMVAPSANGFDALKAATEQLETFGRVDEVKRLLNLESTTHSTLALELLYRAHLRSGDLEQARASLTTASDRADRSPWVRTTLAQLLQLVGDSAAAQAVYAALEPHENTPLAAALAGELLAAEARYEEAVNSVLKSADSEAIALDFALEPEVDPRVHELRSIASRRSSDPEPRKQALAELLSRLSDAPAIAQTALALGRTLAADCSWKEAWQALRLAQPQRLPAVSLGLTDAALVPLTWEMQYHEWSATEPIDTGTVLYESSLGESTSCNPLAICLELLRDPSRSHLTHVWSITARATIAPELLEYPQVKFVRKGSIGHMRVLATAEFLVNNATWEHCFVRREGQHALNTWHGVPWKTLGRDLRTDSFAYGNVARSFLQASLILVPDPHTRDVLTRGMAIDHLVDPQAVVLGGYPRNDLAINLSPQKRDLIRERIGVPDADRLVVFMPTWKGLFGERDAEVEGTLAAAQEMACEGYTVAVRAHQYVRESFATSVPPRGVRFIPEDLDTNEILGAADALVSDFSSVIFDAAAVRLPVVLLTADIEKYEAQRGLYFSPEEVPGEVAPTASDAQRLIQEALIAPEDFTRRYEAQSARFSAEETGASATHAVAMLFDGVRPQQEDLQVLDRPKTLLLATGGLPPNGITRAARSLLWSLKDSPYTTFLPLNANSVDTARPDTIADVRKYAAVLPIVGRPAGTRMEREVLRFFSGRDFARSPWVDGLLRAGRAREGRRLFGHTAFDAVVEYGAYDSSSIALMAYGVPVSSGQRGVVLHSEMWKEVTSRYPRLRAGMSLLGDFDFIASVSEGAMQSNAELLSQHLGVPRNKHVTLGNTINTAEILEGSESPLTPSDAAWYQRPGVHACIVGRLSPEKNHRQFLEALTRLEPQALSKFSLTLLGDGPLMLDLQQLVAEHDLDKNVRFCGMVENPYAHIRHCDALVLPSRHEGQPLVALEALTIGTPVVASDIPGSRSVLRDGELGLLVPLSDEGMDQAVRAILHGRLISAQAFSPKEFTDHAREGFLSAISGEGTGEFR